MDLETQKHIGGIKMIIRRTLLLFTILFLSTNLYSQDVDYSDTLVDGIDASWIADADTAQVAAMDIQEIVTTWIEPDPEPVDVTKLSEADLATIAQDVQFLADLPKSYTDISKEDLKNVLAQIDNKLNRLTAERDSLMAQAVRNEELIKSKENTIGSLGKEKNIINLTLETDDLVDANGNLIGENSDLKVSQDRLKRYLYITLGILAALALVVAIVLQRRRISVQDVELQKQLDDINKKNTYLEHAARIIRHDMHSGINTYMPRGLSSLERRLTQDDIDNFKIAAPLKMIKDGLSHTQRVYKSVYEFTNLVKMHVVLDKNKVDVKDALQKYLENTSYSAQVQIDDLMELEINETLFCNAIDNLIRNGLKYNDSQDKWVKIYKQGDSIIVEDNGRGMSKRQFEKAIKAETEENSKNEISLGLSICNAILKEHGFSFTCKKSEGQGTLIKINTKN